MLHLVPLLLLGVGLLLLVLAYRLWHEQQAARPRCQDCTRTKHVEVYMQRAGSHHQAELVLCQHCADRRSRMAQSLTRKVPVRCS